MSELNYSAMAQQPRGILKNRESRFSNLLDTTASPNDPRLQSSMQLNTGGSDASWMTGVSGGINPVAPPGLRTGMTLESGSRDNELDQALRAKINDFATRKRDVIFKPLEKDELPIPEVHGVGKSSEDHYGLVPSLDHYLRADESEIRRYFFQNTKVGDIFVACVSSKNQSGLFLRLIATEGKRHIVLEDLGVKAFCPSNQLVPFRDRSYDYETGTYVRIEALEVNTDAEKLVCGMKGITLTTEQQHSYTLGTISARDLPRQYTLAKAEGESRRRNYQEALISSLGFKNPNNVQHLATTMGLISGNNNTSTLLKGLRGSFPAKEMAANLRRVQNAKWAHENVAHGIKYFKAGKFTEAFQCLNKALSIDAENVEGLVARGALYANKGNFEKAIEDFETALKFNSSHYNARKYLAETLVALGKQQEEGLKLEDAVASYSKCLVIKSDHKEAKEALWSVYERTNKLDISKLAPPAAAKASELKDKLKAILQTELCMRMEAKNGVKEKEKKSKKKKNRKSSGSEDESSSSSSSSDSESSSSEDSRSRKKKKSKKKKKKSKKGKKASRDDSKARAVSLSPFSKRLVDPQEAATSGLAGFGQSTYEEWGQQLGLPSKTDRKAEESDEEPEHKKKKDKKRSKKKDKRKKRKRTSSSSSSSDTDNSRSKDRKKSKSGTADNSITNRSSIEGILPDLGDLEAKLSAYYSKIEQVKMEPVIPPEAVKITVDRSGGSFYPRDAYNEPLRKIEVKPNSDDERERNSRDRSRHHNVETSSGNWQDPKFPSKIELKTDEYGNFLHSEHIVRTVHNDTTTLPEQVAGPKPIKFEMKFKTAPNPPQISDHASGGDSGGTKWRPLGTGPQKEDDDENDKEPQKPSIKNPFEVQKYDRDLGGRMGRDQDRNYRGRKSFRSRSPSVGRRRPRRSRSFSRSRSSSYSSRSRSRSRSPNYRVRRNPRDQRFDHRDRRDFGGRDNYRGRGGGRFFRGYNRGGRRPYVPQRGRTYRPNGPSRSKFRNRFSRSPSGSASRSRSRSRSKSRTKRSTSRGAGTSKSRSRSPGIEKRDSHQDKNDQGSSYVPKSPRNQSTTSQKKVGDDHSAPIPHTGEDATGIADNEIQIGTLTTTKASEVEELLDKRNAEKKEELRKSNPDFFRTN